MTRTAAAVRQHPRTTAEKVAVGLGLVLMLPGLVIMTMAGIVALLALSMSDAGGAARVVGVVCLLTIIVFITCPILLARWWRTERPVAYLPYVSVAASAVTAVWIFAGA